MRITRALLFAAPFSLLSSGASAQVLITEVMPNTAPAVEYDEWIEIQNTGTATAVLDGWTINDYVGSTPNGESTTRWTFPPGSMIGPGEVIVVTRQSTLFADSFGVPASYELADQVDDPLVPNLTPAGGTSTIQIGNGATGDAIVLRDNQGNIVSAVEWGTVDRDVPGTPYTAVPAQLESLIRVDTTGNSADDFVVTANPTPFVGFMSAETMIVGTTATPRHALYGSSYTVTTMVNDADGINTVEIYFGTSTSSAGPAVDIYQAATMTSTGSTYSYTSPVANLAGGFGEPEDFHSRYIRFFIAVEDNNNDVTTDPMDAVENEDNENYLPVYIQNVVPNGTSSIAAVRVESAEDTPRWMGHSVRVRGLALIENGIMDPARTLFTIQDDSGSAIAVFSATTTPDFTVGDELEIVGAIDVFRGSTQLIDPVIEVTGNTGNVPQSDLTIEEILTNGEQFEAQLVKINDLDFVQPRTTWPSDPNDLGSWNVLATDGTNQITLRVTSGTDLFGQPAPQYGFDIVGVLNERDGTWQVFPRSMGDVSPHPAPDPPDGGVVDMDAMTMMDAGNVVPDSGMMPGTDAGTNPPTDSGTGNPPPDEEGCDCSATHQGAPSSALAFLLLALCAFIRKRR